MLIFFMNLGANLHYFCFLAFKKFKGFNTPNAQEQHARKF